jgi:hypothetical protein
MRLQSSKVDQPLEVQFDRTCVQIVHMYTFRADATYPSLSRSEESAAYAPEPFPL